MNPLLSQILGISLAVVTALGCLAYERLVKISPYWFIGLLVSFHYVPFWLGSLYIEKSECPPMKGNWGTVAVFLVSGITGPIWYVITKNQGMLVSSTYEVKYIGVLAFIYVIGGGHRITLYTCGGVAFALLSIWCLSHAK